MMLLACASAVSVGFDPQDGDRLGGTATTEAGVRVEETDKPTVLRFSWETDAAATGAIELTEGDPAEGYTRTVPATSEDGHVHEAVVTGLAAGATYSWRAVWEEASGTQVVTGGGELQIDEPPDDLPLLLVETDDGSQTDDILLTLITPETWYAVVIIDRQGRYLWWQEGDDVSTISQARLSLDGEHVEWSTWEPSNAMHRMRFDGSEHEVYEAEGVHHDFWQVEDGWISLVRDTREVEDEEIMGDRLDHIDFDGAVETLWTVWDEFDYDEDEDGAYTADGDWTHFNSIEYEEDLDKWWISVRDWDAVFQIDGSTWTTDWVLGGRHSDFDLESGDEFQQNHSARRVGDGNLLIFDNGDQSRNTTRVVEYSVDEDALTYAQVWEVWGDDFARYTGNAERLDDGGTFIVWGSGGSISDLDADGNLRWSLTRDDMDGFGYGRPIGDF